MAAVAVAAVVGLSPTRSGAQELTFAFAHPALDQAKAVSEVFLAEIKNTNGDRIKINYHPGDLGDWTEIFEEVLRGSVPMAITGLASDFDSRLDIAYLGYVVDDWKTGLAMYGPGGLMLPVYNGILNDNGINMLGTVPLGFGGLGVRKDVTARPVNFPEDTANFKMRVPPLQVAVKRYEAWGFNAVTMPWAEIYTALQLGTIDGRSYAPPEEILQMKDVLGAYVMTNDTLDQVYWVVNKAWWDELQPDLRETIAGAVNKAVAAGWKKAEADTEVQLEQIREAGIEVITLDEKQMEKAKTLVFDQEWPWMEANVGSELMSSIRDARKAAESR
jgi:TRAP-type C4-dicarboxylate transport system substrate-binding protein